MVILIDNVSKYGEEVKNIPIENRVEIHNITKLHYLYNFCDTITYYTKSLYNFTNYTIRQHYFKTKEYLHYYDACKIFKKEDVFRRLPSNVAQQCLKSADQDWKSFFKGLKAYNKNPSKFLGRPQIPKYKKKDGRSVATYTWVGLRRKGDRIYFTNSDMYIQTKRQEKIQQIRIVPVSNIYKAELIYKKEIPEIEKKHQKILGIDIGLDNFATCVNNVGQRPIIINGKALKSINQYYNKKKAKLQSYIKNGMSNKLYKLVQKRNNKIKYTIHCYSKFIVDYCLALDIDTIVIGNNPEWKQELSLGKRNNQNFTQIPFEMFIGQVQYKGKENGIDVIITEESYTSGTSFIDGELPVKSNYDKSRRISRGLFRGNDGIVINADVNGSYQIVRKVFPNAFDELKVNGIEGVDCHPIRVTPYKQI
jgi:putative transposase